MKKSKIITDGILQNNPAFMLFLGMCPTLATTSNVVDAFGMGLAVLFTIILTNVSISLVRKIVPNEIRIPVLIVIIATIVTVLEMLMNAFMVSLYQSLGVYLSLIVVNCIILGRAEAFALKNNPLDSFLDALGTGIGFLGGLLLLSFFRELLGTGAISFKSLITGVQFFELRIIPKQYAISLFSSAPGAFIMFGLLAAGVNFTVTQIKNHKVAKAEKLALEAQKESGEGQ